MSIVAIKDALVSAMSGSEAFGIGGAGTNYDVLVNHFWLCRSDIVD